VVGFLRQLLLTTLLLRVVAGALLGLLVLGQVAVAVQVHFVLLPHFLLVHLSRLLLVLVERMVRQTQT
jgi:hypothetical protein